ncbi:Inner membrane protein YbaN [Variovorax sp. PBS-H4]|uniref:YbaN family protein n=1 Tax=Variovorax sp. PBS-H4 TaxID=434008 RepID=UPI001318E33D|nr:YbaN family protein [Variovorax sp. PBS-H4]VTU28671.1 Inner membrane protein YbaN [Variovorax sp. PBS-H4]
MSSPKKPRRLRFRLSLSARVARLLWRMLAILFMVLGVLGVLLPIVPTVPFLLAAAWAAGRGWPALEQWLLGHPRYGEPIRQWRSGGVVPRRAKWGATLMMFCSAILLALTPAPLALKASVPAVMAMVAIWLWSRPES